MLKETILLYLGQMYIGYTIKKDEPDIIDTSTLAQLNFYDHWERFNRITVMFIKIKISTSIFGSY